MNQPPLPTPITPLTVNQYSYSLNLSPDIAEISQEKLLSLIAKRLIVSNRNINDKDAGYAENQQQNISDAIDLLPRLTTDIDWKRPDQTVNTIERGTLKCVDSNALSYQNIDAKLPEAVSKEATLMQSNCILPASEVSENIVKMWLKKLVLMLRIELKMLVR
ncbi:Protein FAM63B-like [Forsythia ovata]|uniref:Protein FAM63B-like n=1 Tax=Forsythia ovata TaxID=205694 RepID=A0ABD1TPD7_9LAMI